MTRDQIISLGVTPEMARDIAVYLKVHPPLSNRSTDPTTLVNNEGIMTGWISAANFIALLAVQLDDKPSAPVEMYSEALRK